jgi:DNA-binding SARP family transcriptional activator/predicted ATPase
MPHTDKDELVARLDIAVLGAPRIEVDGTPIVVDTRKAIALLAYLAVSGEQQRRDTLAALFWPDADEARARGALRRTLSTLSSALGSRWLVTDRDQVALAVDDDVRLDVAAFRAQLAGDRGPAARRAAVALYRGDFMAGFTLRDSPAFDDWQRYLAESLRRELAGALERLVTDESAAGSYQTASADARRWLALDPLHEEAHRRLMLVYAWAGERGAALRQYRECVRVLDQELGVAPLEETTALHQAIQERREPPPPAPSSEPPPTPAVVDEPAHAPERDPTSRDYPLVGRDDELRAIAAAYAAVGPDGRLVAIEGEAGVGKTRLADAALQRARERGAVVITARCYEGEAQLAFGPLVEGLLDALQRPEAVAHLAELPGDVLVEASRLLPRLASLRPGLPAPVPLDSPGAQARFFDGLLALLIAILTGPQPGVLFIDDAHWIDSASLDLLAYIARRLRGHPMLLLAAWRGEQLAEDHRLRRVLAEGSRGGSAAIVRLERLDPDAVRALVCAVAGDIGADREMLARRLHQETNGLPYFLVEYLAELRRNAAIAGSGEVWPLPGGVRDLLHARLASASSAEMQLLSTMAAVGRAASFDTLRDASGRSEEETLGAIESALAHGLVVERGSESADVPHEPLYDVGHDKLRELIYAETSLARRRLLHRRIAGALETHPRGAQRDQLASVIAHHYRLAGQDADAAGAHLVAGDAARRLYANTEAIAHYQAALALGHPDVARLHERIGELQVLLGAYENALSAYETAAALTEPAASPAIEHKLGTVYHRLGEWRLAEQHYAAADALLSASGAAGASERARLHVDWSLTAHRRGDAVRARDLGEQALDLAEATGDSHALARGHNLLGILARTGGDLSSARVHLDESLRLAGCLDDAGIRAAALNNLAQVEREVGNGERAIELMREALSICIAQGDRHSEAALHSNLADLLHAAGRGGEALEHLRLSAAIYAEIGVVAGEYQPEIWKLSEW